MLSSAEGMFILVFLFFFFFFSSKNLINPMGGSNDACLPNNTVKGYYMILNRFFSILLMERFEVNSDFYHYTSFYILFFALPFEI